MFKKTTDEDLMPEDTQIRRLSYYFKTREERNQINASKNEDLKKEDEVSSIDVKVLA